MNDEYPLYLEFNIIVQNQTEEITKKYLENFKKKCIGILDELTEEYISTIIDHIENDICWDNNIKQEIVNELCDYGNREIKGVYIFDKIRRSILGHYRNEIIEDLNQDVIQRNEKLNHELIYWKEKYDELLINKC
jgi:hypothetical protein